MKFFNSLFFCLLLASCSHTESMREVSSINQEQNSNYSLERDTQYAIDLANFNEVLLSKELNKKSKKKVLETMRANQFNSFLSTLSTTEYTALNNTLNKIKDSKEPLTQMVSGEGSPVLLIHGLYYEDFASEFLRPIHSLIGKKRNSYFYKWDKRFSIEKHRDQFIEAIKTILNKHPDQKLTIIAYCAGGIIATLALYKIYDEEISKRIYLHTMASPFFGYNAPNMAFMGVPFVGSTTIAIGKGAYKKFIHPKLKECHNWINTNCELDQHACDYKGMNPELGPSFQEIKNPPCGIENTTTFNDENHGSIINRVFFEIMRD